MIIWENRLEFGHLRSSKWWGSRTIDLYISSYIYLIIFVYYASLIQIQNTIQKSSNSTKPPFYNQKYKNKLKNEQHNSFYLYYVIMAMLKYCLYFVCVDNKTENIWSQHNLNDAKKECIGLWLGFTSCRHSEAGETACCSLLWRAVGNNVMVENDQ